MSESSCFPSWLWRYIICSLGSGKFCFRYTLEHLLLSQCSYLRHTKSTAYLASCTSLFPVWLDSYVEVSKINVLVVILWQLVIPRLLWAFVFATLVFLSVEIGGKLNVLWHEAPMLTLSQLSRARIIHLRSAQTNSSKLKKQSFYYTT